MRSQTRLTPPVALSPIDGDTDLALLVDYDRETARLASESLAQAENDLRTLSPWRPMRRATLLRVSRIQRETLIALGANLRPAPPTPLSTLRARRAVAWRQRKDSTRGFFEQNTEWFGVLAFLCAVATAITVPVMLIDGPNQTEQGREARARLELLLRAETRYAAANEGRYTADWEKLDDVTPDGTDADMVLYNMQSDTDLVVSAGGYDALLTEGPRFRLRVSQDGTVLATCRAQPVHGCDEGRWSPEQAPAR